MNNKEGNGSKEGNKIINKNKGTNSNTNGIKNIFARPNKILGLSMGIVGLPNVGKSTLFNALTNSSVRAENFAFCTKDPHTGIVKIEDSRLRFLTEKYQPKKSTNATLTVIDIAGLVKGSSEGVGLGNHFLEHIRRVDGIFLVCRCFDDAEITHVEGAVDPINDIEIIKYELRMKDVEHLQKAKQKVEKDIRSDPHDKKARKNLETVGKMQKTLETCWIRDERNWDQDEIAFINTLNLLTVKNVVILANISERHYRERKGNKHLKRVMEKYKHDLLVFSAVHVTEDGSISPEFVEKLVRKGYDSLDLINYFTAGKDEVKSWTIRRGMKAPEAAGVIHTDFENYFVSVDVMGYSDFEQNPSEVKMKAAGKFLQKGKDYTVNDGDILHFKANPPKSGKKK
ncbi:hypothetical protein NUSPORA_00570 [Nucleospora cyclopteri]